MSAVALRVSAIPLIRWGNTIEGQRQNMSSGDSSANTYSRFMDIVIKIIGPSLKYYLRIDVSDVRSIGKIQEWVGDVTGMDGVWIESDPDRAVRRQYVCSIAGSSFKDSEESFRKCHAVIAQWFNKFLEYYNPDFGVESIQDIRDSGYRYCDTLWKRKIPWNERRED